MKRRITAAFLLLGIVSCSTAARESSTLIPTIEEPTSSVFYPNLPPDPQGATVQEWRGIPIMPQATSGQESGSAYQFTANTDPSTVQAFYNERLTALGWSRPFEDSFGAEGGTMTFRKEGSSLVITVTPGQESVTVILVLTLA